MILRLDNLPGQKSKAVEDYHAGKQTSMEWSAPDCHEGATLAEVSFMHDVPKTLACLKQAPDLNDERHFYQAWKTVEKAANKLSKKLIINGETVLKSAEMIYFNLDKPKPCMLLGFGSAVKAYISLDSGRSKY